jgi:HTH-like domain
MPLGTAIRKNTETPKPVDPVPIKGTGSVSFCIVVGNQRAVRLRRLRTQLPATLRTFISEYDAGLDESITSDSRYEFRLRVLQELAPKDPDALAVQFTRYDDMDNEQRVIIEAIGKRLRGFDRTGRLVSRFQFVADHRDTFEVKWLCAVVEVARSSFYAWLAAADTRAAKTAADEALQARIGTVHTRGHHLWCPRITAELNDGVDEVDRVNHERVARVMRTAGIAGYRRKRRVKTTVADPANQRVPDLLGRDFTAAAPNATYVGDF